jgi:hypothetical protein
MPIAIILDNRYGGRTFKEIGSMSGELASALDRRIREIIQTAYEAALPLATAYKSETGKTYPLVFGGTAPSAAKVSAPVDKAESAGPGRKKKRERRSTVQLQKDALAIVDFVKSKGKEGVDGSVIRAQFSKVGQSIKDYVKKYGKVKLNTQGHGIAMRYYA